ncbi:hypothetical protein A9726_04315 [Campylobacter helveticus]|uniref:hypothetical protein n=2 Tax=Campylobacter helveticus TaxID=28898 RepID=UPI0009C208DB|nr:hypothetical protein [Campylobacter helveticus]ARE80363.1 hypothetical protein CHELV3228_0765 [Campylobacter helveticus]TXK54932.1 hypothetical protein A9726_04315 [Campylobacter helveticus]
MRAMMKNKIVKARGIISEIYELNAENMEIVESLMREGELMDMFDGELGEMLETLRENSEKIHSLL